jgi:hypothetical protein
MTTFQVQSLYMPASSFICRCFPISKKFLSARVIYISFFLSLFLVPNFCLAQRERLGGLKKVLPSLRDSAKVDCLNAIFMSYYWLRIVSFKYYLLPAYEESGREFSRNRSCSENTCCTTIVNYSEKKPLK